MCEPQSYSVITCMLTPSKLFFSSLLMAPIVPVMGEITNAKGELADDNLPNAVPFWASSCNLALRQHRIQTSVPASLPPNGTILFLIDCFLWAESLTGSAKICIDKESTLGGYRDAHAHQGTAAGNGGSPDLRAIDEL